MARATLVASGPTQSTRARTAYVGASVGQSVGRTAVGFAEAAGCLRARADHPVLVGDVAFLEAPTLANVAGVEGTAGVENILGRSVSVNYQTATRLVIQGGTPGGTVRVRMPAARLVELAYDDAGTLRYSETDPESPATRVIDVPLNAQGTAMLAVFSRGVFHDGTRNDGTVPADAAIGHVPFEVTDLDAPDPLACGATATASVAVVEESVWGSLVVFVREFVVGAVTGEGNGAAAVAGDLVLGSLPVVGLFTDGRDLIKELATFAVGGDVSWAVFTFAAIGLVAEFPIFKAAGLDAALNLSKIVAKQMRRVGGFAESFGRYVLDGIRRFIDEGDATRLQRLALGCADGFAGGSGAACSVARVIVQNGDEVRAGGMSYKDLLRRASGSVPDDPDAYADLFGGGLGVFHERFGQIAPDPDEFLRLVIDVPLSTGMRQRAVASKFQDFLPKVAELGPRLDDAAGAGEALVRGGLVGSLGAPNLAKYLDVRSALGPDDAGVRLLERYINLDGMGKLIDDSEDLTGAGFRNQLAALDDLERAGRGTVRSVEIGNLEGLADFDGCLLDASGRVTFVQTKSAGSLASDKSIGQRGSDIEKLQAQIPDMARAATRLASRYGGAEGTALVMVPRVLETSDSLPMRVLRDLLEAHPEVELGYYDALGPATANVAGSLVSNALD